MKQMLMRGMLLIFLAIGVNQNVSAHVNYFDITNVGTAGFDDTFTPYGWAQGQIQPSSNPPLQGALATTDDVNWYSFTLTSATDVTLTLAPSDARGAGTHLVAPAFSLYSGLFVDQSFDDNNDIPLLAGERGLVNTAQSFSLSTQTSVNGADIRTVHYITSATDGTTDTHVGTGTAQLVNYLLGPGSYSIIAGGNQAYTVAQDGNQNYGAIISLTTTPVPVPAGFWLMSSALVGLGVFGRRKTGIIA